MTTPPTSSGPAKQPGRRRAEPTSPELPERAPARAGKRAAAPVEESAPSPAAHELGNRTYLIADVEPLDVDGVRTMTVGVIAWAIATVGLLPFYGRLREDGNLWWLWTCLAGLGLGLYGLEYCRRRRKSRLEGRTPLR